MHNRSRTKTLEGSVTAKLSGHECQRVKERAEAAGLTVSEWTRRVVVQAREMSPDTRFLAEELAVLRAALFAGGDEIEAAGRKADAIRSRLARLRRQEFEAGILAASEEGK